MVREVGRWEALRTTLGVAAATAMARGAVALAVVLALWGCRVPAAEAEPNAPVGAVNRTLLQAPVVRIELLSVNGESVPEKALAASMETIGEYLAGRIEVVDRGGIERPALEEDGTLAGRMEWPSLDWAAVERGEIALEPVSERTTWYRAREREGDGEGGKGGRVVAIVTELMDGSRLAYPMAEPTTILVAAISLEDGGPWVTGYHHDLAGIGDDKGATFDYAACGSMVVLNGSVIRERSGPFVSETKLWEYTLTHEIGHALGVPASATHARVLPGRGTHCTRPECVMYAAADWRTVLSGLLHGWPLDFCEACAGELRSAVAAGLENAGADRAGAGTGSGVEAGLGR